MNLMDVYHLSVRSVKQLCCCTNCCLTLMYGANECVFVFVAEKWSPALQIRTVLLSIQALLSAPNPDDPLANDVAEQWKVNEGQAIETGNH